MNMYIHVHDCAVGIKCIIACDTQVLDLLGKKMDPSGFSLCVIHCHHAYILCSLCQVTCQYKLEGGACVPTRVHTIVISVQHSEEVTLEQLRADLMEKVVKAVIPAKYLDAETVYHLQVCPAGGVACRNQCSFWCFLYMYM